VSRLRRWLDAALYPHHRDFWDDTLLRREILGRLRPELIVLDYGAGRGASPQLSFRGEAQRVVGVDPDTAVLGNPFLDEAHVLPPNGRIPVADATFDLAFAHNVLEHVEDPESCLREIHRVLVPGGVFVAKTPNRWHYVALIARLVPQRLHVVAARLTGRADEDAFPTVYRCNTPEAIRRYAGRAGFEVTHLELVEGRPEYLRKSTPTYLAGYLYERAVNTIPGLDRLRCVLIVVLRKPA
jgi:SAM-dependent methyltransferase